MRSENPKIKEMEPWYRLVTPITGLKEHGGDGWVISGRGEILFNPFSDMTINISSAIFYNQKNGKIEVFSGGYVGGKLVLVNGQEGQVNKGLYLDDGYTSPGGQLEEQMILEMFRNFYFGRGRQKLEGPFSNSKAVSRVRYNRDRNSYFSVFRGLPENFFLLSTEEESQWKYPHFIVFPHNIRELKVLRGREEQSKSFSEYLASGGGLTDFLDKVNPYRLEKVERSGYLVRKLRLGSSLSLVNT